MTSANLEKHHFSRLIRLSSNQRDFNDTSQTNTDFRLNLHDLTQTNNVVRIVLKSLSIPHLAYNIRSYGNSSDNSTINYSINGVDFARTFPNGQYTLSQVTAQLIIWMNLDSAIALSANTYSIVGSGLHDTSKKLIITQTGTDPTFFYLQGNGPTPSNASNWLGVVNETPVVATGPITFGIPMLNGIQGCYVKSEELARSNLADGSVKLVDYVSGHIPFDVEWGQIQNYQAHDGELDSLNIRGTPINIDSVDLQIVDENDNVLVLESPEAEIVVIVKVYYAY